jgi:hypothetical protein
MHVGGLPVTKGSVQATRNQALAALVEINATKREAKAEFNITCEESN